jgi:hypothetical protein
MTRPSDPWEGSGDAPRGPPALTPHPLDAPPRYGPFVPLRWPRFRALWLAGLVSFLGTWVHNVAARWTAATLSESALAV